MIGVRGKQWLVLTQSTHLFRIQIRVKEGAPAAEKELQEIRFPSGTLVISDDEGLRIARPDTRLSPGKRYLVAVEPDVANEVMNLLRGS